jgi:hypothetical protein
MRFPLLGHFFHDSNRERMIHEHGSWLTEALQNRREFPQIPVRKVSEGGFARLSSSDEGRRIARLWWETALQKVD